MLECAADIGDNGRSLSFVIGTPEAIQGSRRSIPHHFTHMRQIGRQQTKQNILKALKAGSDVMMFCFQINRPQIVRNVFKLKGSKLGRGAKQKIHEKFDYVLINEIHKIINNYLIKHNSTINDLVVEVDSDMRKPFKTVGLKTTNPKIAHEIADVVVWANTKNQNHKDIRHLRLATTIEQAILNKIR